MNPNKRTAQLIALIELAALGLTVYLVSKESGANLGLVIQRAGYLTCQQIARAFGALAIELEKSYRAKVAP
jgi:hypothetical protein